MDNFKKNQNFLKKIGNVNKFCFIFTSEITLLTQKITSMKKFFISCLSIAAVVLTGCKEGPDGPDAPTPELELAGGNVTLTVSAEGGTQSITYNITNPVDGGVIEAVPADSWINTISVDEANKTISFNVDPNEVAEARSQLLSVTYTYGEGLVVKKEMNVIQNAGMAYDYVYEMTSFSSMWYGDMYGLNGENNYYTWISDMPFTEEGYTQVGGNYYLFDIYGPFPDDETAPVIPAGTYTLGEYGATAEWTFSPDYSKAVRYNEEGLDYQAEFADGTLTVAYDSDGNVVMEAILTDTEGKMHHLTYTGVGLCVDDRPVDPGLGEDLEFTASLAAASYAAGDGANMEIVIQFTDMDVDGEGYIIPPGTILAVDAIMPYDEDGNLATGTYTVSGDGTSMTVYPGEDFLGMFTIGTYATNYVSDSEYYTTLVAAGTMEISGSAGNYTVSCNFVGSDGFSIKTTYTGAIEVQGMPGPISTLTGDYTLDLEGATAVATTWGDYYGTGGNNYTVQIMPTTGPDGLLLDLVSDSSVDGIASGTYTVSASGYPNVGEYLEGYMSGTNLGGTMYVGGFTEEGSVTAYAPATTGNLDITNNGDGTYNISFSFVDDLGYTWDGEWSGEITIQSGSSASPARNRTYVEAPARPAVADNAQIFENLALKVGESAVPATNSTARKFVKR